ncbi:MAG: hypothetical protein V4671_04340 [Armatimonadota bacterium]
MGQLITCTSAGVYALTRGCQYELLAHDAEKQQVRVRADLGRGRWFPADNFDLTGGSATLLTAWRFADPVVDELNGWDETNNWVVISLTFDDGRERWCQMATPDYLKGLLAERSQEPMVYARNLIVVRNLMTATMEQILRYLDQQGELMEYSLPYEPPENAETSPDSD